MDTFLKFLTIVVMVAVVAVLIRGLVNMMRGGSGACGAGSPSGRPALRKV